jgi:hypothetical protein
LRSSSAERLFLFGVGVGPFNCSIYSQV